MNIVNVIVEGGIGDLVIALPLIQNYLNEPGYKIHLYSSFPEIVSMFLPFVKALPSIPYLRRDRNDFDYSIAISDMVYFFKKPGIQLPKFLCDIYDNWTGNYEEWKEYLDKHPFKANEMCHKSLSIGKKRWTLPFHLIGKETKEYILSKEIEEIKIPNKFITIHDGFDATNHYKFIRSMKSWDIKYWEKFVSIFKKKYPDVHVIQLGGIKHQPISGVDINFAGQLEFSKTLEYLKSSILHIDGDSGLVHTRRLFKKQSLVMFGPTNVDYFGYPENMNVAPKFCGDCWWKTSDWMKNCKDKYEVPRCMDSITPEHIIELIENNRGIKCLLSPSMTS